MRPPADPPAGQLSLLDAPGASAADTLDTDQHGAPIGQRDRVSGGGTAEPDKRVMEMQSQPKKPSTSRADRRRPRGTGAVFQKGDRWYGQWYRRRKLIKRSLGPVRMTGQRNGLTRTQAEARLRELMLEVDAAPLPVAARMTIAEVSDRRIKQLTRTGRKPDTTLANYESETRIHFVPHFGAKPVDEIAADDVEDFIDGCLDAEDRLDRGLAELSVKTVRNLYVHLNGIFEFAISKAGVMPTRAAESTSQRRPRTTTRRSASWMQPSSTRFSSPRPRACVSTRRRRSAAPPRRERCAMSRAWSGDRSASGSGARPPRRCTCTGRRPMRSSKMIWRALIVRSISPRR
jgi:hypothetical protein